MPKKKRICHIAMIIAILLVVIVIQNLLLPYRLPDIQLDFGRPNRKECVTYRVFWGTYLAACSSSFEYAYESSDFKFHGLNIVRLNEKDRKEILDELNYLKAVPDETDSDHIDSWISALRICVHPDGNANESLQGNCEAIGEFMLKLIKYNKPNMLDEQWNYFYELANSLQ